MDFKIKWSPRSVAQFEHICEFISLDSEVYARIFAQRVFKLIENITLFPHSGRIVPEYDDENLRELLMDNYRIVYRLKTKVIEIVEICHTAQLFTL